MKRLNLTLALAVASALCFTSTSFAGEAPGTAAPWQVSLNYWNMGEETDTGDINTGSLMVGFGYQFDHPKGHISFVPEIYLGRSVNNGDFHVDDDMGNKARGKVELESIFSFGGRIILNTSDSFSVYLRPTYTTTHVDKSFPDTPIENIPIANRPIELDTDWDFGLGVGVNAKINKNFSVSAGFDRINGDTDLLSVAARYHF
jgi:hypothetical protein